MKVLIVPGALLLLILSGAQVVAQEDAGLPDKTNPLPETVSPADRRRLNQQVERALKRFDHEPSLAELENAALRLADAHVEGSKNWSRLPNLAAVLPTLKFVADYDLGRDEALDRYQDEPDRWGADTDRGYGFQLSAQWKLDELVFNSDEVRIYDAIADRAQRRDALHSLIIGYYFERRRLQLTQLLVPPGDIGGITEMKMRIAELTASIDALTGGLLSDRIKKKATTKTIPR
jgi:hypothetical protein